MRDAVFQPFLITLEANSTFDNLVVLLGLRLACSGVELGPSRCINVQLLTGKEPLA